MPLIRGWCRIFDHSSLLIQPLVPLPPLQDLKRLKNPGSFKSKRPGLATFSALGPHELLLSLHVRKKIALQSAQGLDAGKWFFVCLRELHLMYCQPYNSYNVSSDNLVLDQLIIPKLIFFLCSHHFFGWYCRDIVRKILSWSFIGVKGLKELYYMPLATSRDSC